MVVPQVRAAKRLLHKVCGHDTKEVVTIIISFSPKDEDPLPGLQVNVGNAATNEKASFDSCSKMCSEKSDGSIGGVSGASIVSCSLL